MGEGGWRGLGKDEIRWCGYLEAERMALLDPTSNGGAGGGVVFLGTNNQLSIDPTNLYWDNTNNRLGIGTSAPENFLDIVSIGSVTPMRIYKNNTDTGNIEHLNLEQDGSGDTSITFRLTGTRVWQMGIDNDDSDKFKLGYAESSTWASNSITFDTTGNVGIGTATPLNLVQLSHASGGIFLGSSVSELQGLRIFNSSTTPQTGSSLIFTMGATGTAGAAISAIRESADYSTLRFQTESNNVISEKFRLDASGGAMMPSTNLNPIISLTEMSGAFFVSGGAFFYKGDQGTITELAPR